jgi:hypothetical protein
VGKQYRKLFLHVYIGQMFQKSSSQEPRAKEAEIYMKAFYIPANFSKSPWGILRATPFSQYSEFATFSREIKYLSIL